MREYGLAQEDWAEIESKLHQYIKARNRQIALECATDSFREDVTPATREVLGVATDYLNWLEGK